ncbi:hypothetical protein HMPREF1425_00296 [Helicobacter pylori GAM71Ai]|nr:hypothetical protein HMPREF1405_01524 [Helicobacter pylori GAM231Ai]EMH37186.1 hypothetical protein HMPREF1425_00296 [Helicobacter pylori GAM71Ai]EMH42980.1 hypothetical protein HMPREF1431_00825 [Helicobacter pylori GAMchJs106B]EMJ39267.1 hypothetical protein HMPREF1433_01453 [Helicobacter pylori GAMchJs117Ai]EMJ44549.1 hypothetical protein HMPREF1434_00348 [Helicobacter pylori GAMchJs124i]
MRWNYKTKTLISQGSQEMKTSESYNQILEEARTIMDKAE